ncbi:MAG: type II toxin-antitoxin system PemK/MazF family toxin [Parcubacteria group bacterium]|nr:type II toxin-antitoxin system PemK/MazF family toxin [Parcubacteria group bacterium]MBI3074887.1 type II toxin-antitoxin system PemK/MazF family toxin [Parcubacteria group bacterium]
MIEQGEIYLADLNPVKGHEQSGFRPVLVLQNNALNNILNTIVVAPITSNEKAKGKLITYFLPKHKTMLDKDSIVLLFQIRTIDKRRLRKKIYRIPQSEITDIKKQLGFVF